MKELPKAYEPQQYEDAIYKKWEDSGLFNPDVCISSGFTKNTAPYFSIVLPPPNVTGTLHMGHAAMLAIEDVMVRYHRMKGDRTLWVPGTDHAAIATQAKVEKLVMEKEGKTKYDLGRPEFLKRVEQFAQESHDTIVNQARKMGASLDWSREAYTLDEKRNLAVRTVFKKMYDDGLIYRGYRVINWSVKGQSTVSDDEMVHVERPAKLYYFKYSKDFPITIATTRPETKLGDTAVAVNPKDKRYKKYIGQEFIVDVGAADPLKIKIIGVDSVESEFGTGALGVTPAHSQVDFEMHQKQKASGDSIGLIQVIDEHGKMMPAAGKYAGMSTLEAREKFVEYLKQNNLLEKEEDIVQNVGTSDRFGDVIEPVLKLQWFVGVEKPFKVGENELGIKKGTEVTLKELMQKVVHKKQIEIIPDHFEKTYFHWIDNLRDWCISRQLWYGHRVPVWYCFVCDGIEPVGIDSATGKKIMPRTEKTKPIVSVDFPTICEKCSSPLQQDQDTLDTWFSSGLWTFSILGYPDLDAKDLQAFHPTSVMETGYDILFFWVARMILMTTYVLGDVPFKTVYLHGLVRDEQGRKMSKSLGNVINPLDMIAKYGTDATRLSLLLGNTPGNDMKLSEEKIAGFRNFTNKLWNISRFMLLNIEEPKMDVKEPKAKTLADEWILEKLNTIVNKTSENIEKYNFSMAGEELRDFTWGDLADWYLEIAKVEGGKSEILNYILNSILKLWHPYMPFVTETIWQEVYGDANIIMVSQWPTAYKVKSSKNLRLFGGLQDSIVAIRGLLNRNNLSRSSNVKSYIAPDNDFEFFKENIVMVSKLTGTTVAIVTYKEQLGLESFSSTVVSNVGPVLIDTAGIIDVQKEKTKLEKEIAEIKKYMVGLENKLSNQEFVNNAPPVVVEKEQTKLSEAKVKVEKLQQQLENLK